MNVQSQMGALHLNTGVPSLEWTAAHASKRHPCVENVALAYNIWNAF